MKAKVLEVFRSIQGEGLYVGVSQVFVRFFECNMHCVWCDTPASIGDTSRRYQEIGLETLQRRTQELYAGCHSVSITGGEPLLQHEFLKDFLPLLRAQGNKVYLETNGTLPGALSEVIDHVDITAMDFKLPSSTGERNFWREHEDFLRIAAHKEVFIKAVVSKTTTDEDVDTAVDLIQSVASSTPLILQPNYFDMNDKNGYMDRCVCLRDRCAQTLKDVRLLPQIHKFMKLR